MGGVGDIKLKIFILKKPLSTAYQHTYKLMHSSFK